MSHNECHDGCCSHHHHSGSHECCTHSHCHGCECECHNHCQKYSDELLKLADDAWMEVIKDEIKKKIIEYSGSHINEIATLVAKSNQARWTYKLDEKKNQEDYEEKLHNLIHRKSKT